MNIRVLLLTSSMKAMISGLAIVFHLNRIWPFNRPMLAAPVAAASIDEEKGSQHTQLGMAGSHSNGNGHARDHHDDDDMEDPFRQPLQCRNLLLTFASAFLYAINDTLGNSPPFALFVWAIQRLSRS
jgi:hypothetical protein